MNDIIDFFDPLPTFLSILAVIGGLVMIFGRKSYFKNDDKVSYAKGFINFVLLVTLIAYLKQYLPEDHILKNVPAFLVTLIYWILSSFLWEYIEGRVMKWPKSSEQK
ncbi:hypothetical protein ACET9H_16900 [Aeromonas media]|uniref:hypothetical protein n=1 Tax=Aeromonas media TaxID=651 RepID=UPI0038D13F0F